MADEQKLAMVRLNIQVGVVLALFGCIAVLWLIPNFVDHVDLEEAGLSPAFFPTVSAVALIVLSAFLVVGNLLKARMLDRIAEEESEENEVLGFGKTEIVNLLIMTAGVLIYMVLMEMTGFIIASCLLLGVSLYFAGIGIRSLILISIVTPVFIKQILWFSLEVVLP